MALAFAGPMPFSALASAVASAVLMLTGSACTACPMSSVATSVGTQFFHEPFILPPCDRPRRAQERLTTRSRGPQSAIWSIHAISQGPRLFTLCRESHERQLGQRQCQVTLATPH